MQIHLIHQLQLILSLKTACGLSISDLNGKEIRVITDQFFSQGINSFNWDSRFKVRMYQLDLLLSSKANSIQSKNVTVEIVTIIQLSNHSSKSFKDLEIVTVSVLIVSIAFKADLSFVLNVLELYHHILHCKNRFNFYCIFINCKIDFSTKYPHSDTFECVCRI